MKHIAAFILTALSASAQPFTFNDPSLLQSVSSLRNTLVGHWRLEESSGVRYDDSLFGSQLQSVGSISNALGISGYGAFGASGKGLYCLDNAALSMGNGVSFTIAAWVNLNSLSADRPIVAKFDSGTASIAEYLLRYSMGDTRFRFRAGNGTTIAGINADVFGAPVTNVWNLVVAGFDGSSIFISVNAGTTNSAPLSFVQDGTNKFEVGIWTNVPAYFSGTIDEVGVWKRRLTSTEISRLYVSGRGSKFPWSYLSPVNTSTSSLDSLWRFEPISPNGAVIAAKHAWQDAGLLVGSSKVFNAFLGADRSNYVSESVIDSSVWSSPVSLGEIPVGGDAHNYCSLIQDTNQYLHAAYGSHSSALFYRKSATANSALSWTSQSNIATTATYPTLWCDFANKLSVIYRGDGSSPTRRVNLITSTNSGTNWSSEVALIDSMNNQIWSYKGNVGLGNEATNAIHLCWTWRYDTGTDDPLGFTNIYYMRSVDSGATWTKSDGTAYTLPVTPATAEIVYTGNSVEPIQVVTDTNSNPIILFTVSNIGYETNSVAKLASLSAGSWNIKTLPITNYYKMPQLLIDANNTYTVLGIAPTGAIYQVFSSVSSNTGTSWVNSQLTGYPTPADRINGVRQKSGSPSLQAAWSDMAGNVRYMKKLP